MMLPRMLAAAAVGLLLLLAYLLIQGTNPETARHERAQTLRELTLNEAALQRDVLQARAGLLRNYDPLVQSVGHLRAAVEELQTAAAQTSDDTRAEIERHTARVAAALQGVETVVESFKSSNALLQNSLSFFMHASRQFQRAAHDAANDDREMVVAEIGTLANAMLHLTGNPRGETATEVLASLDRLARKPVRDDWRQSIRVLDGHGRLIVATLPEVDSLVTQVLAAPVAERTQGLQDAYAAAHARALERANLFRNLLYIAAAILAAYVGHLFLRLRANAQALRARVDFEHLVTAISADFINLPRERIDEGVARGLARLAEHAGVDRAHIVLLGSDAGSLRTEHSWFRAGVGAQTGEPESLPESSPENLPENLAPTALHWRLESYLRRGCIHVPDVERLMLGSERRQLKLQHIRAWLCVPMSYAGKQVGFLMLDTMRRAKSWADDDIALLRMAGEIFATAIERKRIELEREALEARLHQAQRLEAVGTLAGGIAHEFNNILGAILGHGEMALVARGGNGSTLRHVRQIMKAGERARTIIDQVLTFSRRRDPERRPIAAGAVVAEAIELLRASLPATLTVQANLRAEDARIEGDAAQLQQVVMNLCTNAAHAMNGRGTVAIDLAAVEVAADRPLSHGVLAAGHHIRLAVTDTGSGMDADTMRRMFEPFYTTRVARGGTGLGLPTVYGIVADHRGAINIESTPGVGTRFEAYFPRTFASASEPEREAAAPPGNGQTVLLVDDEKPLVSLGEEMLATLGYEPVGFDSSEGALEAFRADPGRFDLVLTDEVMPAMTGTELATKLHQLRPELPIVLMTGYTGPVEVERVRRAGINEVIRKPLLSAAIAQCLARHLH